MDVALEIEEEFEIENYTANSTVKEFKDGLYPQQLAGLLFSLFCLAPNVLLIYIICKNKLNSTLYRTMVNWSVLNSALVLVFLPFNIIPVQYISKVLVEVFFYFGVTLATFTGVLATLFMFEFYLKSDKIVKYSTIAIWSLIVAWDVSVLEIIFVEHMNAHIVLITLDVIMFSANFAFLMRIIYTWIKPKYDETYRLRVQLSSTYLTCVFLIWITRFMTYVHYVYAFITLIATVVIYLDGYVNLILLIYLDPKIKRHFMQIFCASDKYSDIKFDVQNSTVIVVDQNVNHQREL